MPQKSILSLQEVRSINGPVLASGACSKHACSVLGGVPEANEERPHQPNIGHQPELLDTYCDPLYENKKKNIKRRRIRTYQEHTSTLQQVTNSDLQQGPSQPSYLGDEICKVMLLVEELICESNPRAPDSPVHLRLLGLSVYDPPDLVQTS